jgi:hypothetical protein
MDPDCSIPDIPKDILLPQEYVLTGYSRSLLRNPFNACNQKKKMDASIYESKDHPENILELESHSKGNRYRPISSRNDRADIDAQKVFKITFDFLEENGLSERLLKPVIDLDKILVDDNESKIADNVEQTMVRFQEQDHQTLHDRFMKEVKNAINVPLSRPNTSGSGTLYRPATASTRRSATPLKKTRSVTPKEDNDTVVESNASRPQTGAALSNLQKGRKLTQKRPKQVSEIEKAKMVVDFLQTSPLFAGYRSKSSKSLADWKMTKKTEEQIEDDDFSVQGFMRDYVKRREELKDSKPHQKGKKSLLQRGTLDAI